MIMKNPYLKVNRIEFSVTYLCSGSCKHCSIGPKLNEKCRRSVDPVRAAETIKSLADAFDIRSLMTFGGEPLFYPDVTCRIHKTALQCGIPKRQIITNGYFSKDPDTIKKVALSVKDSGANNVLISVDAFHQETIPLEYVRLFAEALIEQNVEGVRFHPAWVINSSHQNSYNESTLKILDSLSDLGIDVSGGNDIFPAGNAEKYLREFYPKPDKIDLTVKCGEAPYTGRLDDVHSLSIEPNGDVSVCAFAIGNIYEEDISAIIGRYDPYRDKMMKALIDGGVKGLVKFAEVRGVIIDAGDSYSACSVCRKTVAALNKTV